MANLSKEDVLKLARLSRLHLTDEEITQFGDEIGAILKYVEQLQDVDLGGLEPMYQVTGLADVVRPDTVRNYGVPPKDLLKNAPATEAGLIKVKRMLDR